MLRLTVIVAILTLATIGIVEATGAPARVVIVHSHDQHHLCGGLQAQDERDAWARTAGRSVWKSRGHC